MKVTEGTFIAVSSQELIAFTIHGQAYRGTTVVEERKRLCSEALDELRTILQPESKP